MVIRELPWYYRGDDADSVLGLKHPGHPNQKVHAGGRARAVNRDVEELYGDDFLRVEVVLDNDLRKLGEREKAVFGRNLSGRQYAELIGAPAGARVEVSTGTAYMTQADGRTTAHPAVTVVLDYDSNGNVKVLRRDFFRNDDGELSVENDMLFLHDDAPAGLGTRMIATEVASARKLGVKKMYTHGVGNGPDAVPLAGIPLTPGGKANGYYTWPRLGYDVAPSSRGTLRGVLDERDPNRTLGKPSTFRELFANPQGAQFWKQNGLPVNLEFDLDKNSYGSRVLRKYAKQKGLVIEGL